MEPIDWDTPIELMDGTFKLATVNAHKGTYWIYPLYGVDVAPFPVDQHGCIGGVQVVRNRQEPVKHVRFVHITPGGDVSLFGDNQQMDNCAKLRVWRDEDGKTKVEVCDD